MTMCQLPEKWTICISRKTYLCETHSFSIITRRRMRRYLPYENNKGKIQHTLHIHKVSSRHLLFTLKETKILSLFVQMKPGYLFSRPNEDGYGQKCKSCVLDSTSYRRSSLCTGIRKQPRILNRMENLTQLEFYYWTIIDPTGFLSD